MDKNTDSLKKMIFSLALANGTPGCEFQAAELAKELLNEYMPTHIDVLGNVCGELPGEGTHILLDAHIDRIGLVVTGIDDDGFIKLTRCGGSDARVLAAAEVTVWGDEPVYGVIISTPVHLSSDKDEKKAKDFEDLAVDTGMSAQELRKIVRAGARITVNTKALELMGGRISCAALDDRAGVAAILRCLELIKDKEHGCRISVLFSAQEETGGSGAATGSFAAAPQEAIAVDVSFAMAPGLKEEKCGKLGGGALIGYAPSLDYNMSCALESVAQKKGIAHQPEVMGGATGTNADEIQTAGKGVKMGLISIPLRNMHTGAEIIDLDDVEAAARLMAEYILERGAQDA